MVRTTSKETKRLVLRYILENADYRKRCLYLQEIVSLGRSHDVWRQALIAFFDTPITHNPLTPFSTN